jgi:hypothetical protein
LGRHLLFLFLLVWSSSFVFGQTQPDTARNYFLKQTQEAISIDGVLNEAVWQNTPKTSRFWQQFPYDTALAITKTEVMMTYDSKNIYVAAICYDTFPGEHIVTSLKRDFTFSANDAFAIYIDPFNDKINGFSFAVNPYGAQFEGLLQNGGSFGVSTDWDNKWFSETTRHKGYWVAEFKIPFKTIRYKKEIATWGVNFSRNNQKINERSTWSFVPRNFGISSLAYTGKLVWDKTPPKAGLNISLIPYAITSFNENYTAGNGGLQTADAGFDAKVSVTPSLNLDLTVNPDFSQVDVDRQVTNLTRFSLFFPERRQFFIENSDLFSRFGFSKIRPFFSRRIGLSNGRNIPIIAGARLSGKLNKNWRIGAMNIQTGAFDKEGATFNPENFTVAAVQRQVFTRSNIGAIVVNKQNLGGKDSTAQPFNRVVGIDYDLASADNKWQGKFFFHHSFSPNQPTNAYAHASWIRYSTPEWFLMWNHEYVGDKYNAEVGFVPRQSVYDGVRMINVPMTYWRTEPEITRAFYPKNSPIYTVKVGVYFSAYADSSFRVNDVATVPYVQLSFLNTAEFSVKYVNNFTYLYFPIDVTSTGNTPLPVGGYNYGNTEVAFSSNRRKLFNFYTFVSGGRFFNGRRISYGGAINYRVQPWANFSLDYRTDEIDLPQPYGYTNLTLIGPKLEFTFSRSVFFTTFIQYNTQIDNVNINTRLQWRFAPMSDLFIVWGDNYLPSPNDRFLPDFRIRNRALVAKLVYWLGI